MNDLTKFALGWVDELNSFTIKELAEFLESHTFLNAYMDGIDNKVYIINFSISMPGIHFKVKYNGKYYRILYALFDGEIKLRKIDEWED